MKKYMAALWHDECGFVVSAELVLVGTLTVVGLAAGISHVRGAVIDEFKDVGDSLRGLDQSYSYGGFKGCKSFTAGSAFYQDGREFEADLTEVSSCQPCENPPPCSPTPSVLSPCGQSPCGQSPCGQSPCGQSPCGQSPCGTQPCGGTPCGSPQPQIVPGPCPTCGTQHVVSTPCPPDETIVEQRCLPSPAPSEQGPCCQTQRDGAIPQESTILFPAPGAAYQGVDGNPQKMVLPYTDSVYNVKRYLDTPTWRFAPQIAPRSSVW